jgi:alkanesulfonate monooxygenase SsuD/methylene tetrahydromethanopterin reductase-like flavin-dependent oxidoreductase (luciferase family)
MPSTHISARPVSGLPEIWIAGDHESGHRLCARRGYVPLFTGRWNGADYQREMRVRIAGAYLAEGRDPERMPLGVQRFMCVTSSRAETLEYVDNARHQMRLANALRRRAEVTDGAMMREIPIPNEISLEEMADNLLVGDCETIAQRLCGEIRAARPSHMMFHFQVGGSSHASALRTMEKLMLDIVPMVERELGPLAEIGTATRQATAVDVTRRDLPRPG